MTGKTNAELEWTDAAWNPIRGCVKVSRGCERCYAEVFAERWRGLAGHPYEHGFDLALVPEKLGEPLGWRRPRRVFVSSMSDLFQVGVPAAFVRKVFETMAAADWHTFQVLTKRPERMKAAVEGLAPRLRKRPNVWLGVSVEDRKHGLPRIAVLRQIPAAIRFLSIEPLLEDLGELDLRKIDWVVLGGENGLGARPLREEWVVSVRDQCRAARVPFFFKQWGGLRKKTQGRLLRGRTYDQFPAVP